MSAELKPACGGLHYSERRIVLIRRGQVKSSVMDSAIGGHIFNYLPSKPAHNNSARTCTAEGKQELSGAPTRCDTAQDDDSTILVIVAIRYRSS